MSKCTNNAANYNFLLARPIAFAIAASLTLLLVACGGGGGGGSTSTNSNTGSSSTSSGTGTGGGASSVQYTPPNTTVPAPTYAASSAKAQFFADINAMRGAAGLSLLAQNTALDTSAQYHANYLGVNYNAATMGDVIDPTTGLLYGHSEDVGKPGFYAATPQERATKAGYAGFAAEVAIPSDAGGIAVPNTADEGDSAFNGLMNTVYHRGFMMQDMLRDIGLGYTSPLEFVADMGYTGTPQPPAAGTLVVYPPTQGEDPYPLWYAGSEQPNPTPTVAPGTLLGGAISIGSPSNTTLLVNSFNLLDANGAPVPCFEMDSTNDPNKNYIWSNQAFLVPKTNLALGASYTAVFSGTVNGAAAQKTWTFTTPSPVLQQLSTGPYVLHNGGTVTVRFKAPAGLTGFSYSSWSSAIPVSKFHATASNDALTMSLDPGAVSSSSTITVTASDLAYPSVPPQTVTITVEP
jgi:uncharacterized protein YkwD